VCSETGYVFDIEGNNLLRDITKIHCVVTQDVDTLEIKEYHKNEEEIYEGLLALYNADYIVGHNIISFDIPAIQKFYPKWKPKKIYDTFILSCLFNPSRKFHSIESYSGGRKVEIENWECLTYEILDRCIIDVIVNTEIFHSFLPKIKADEWQEAIALEQEVASNHVEQLKAGVHVDVEALMNTIECLDAELDALSHLLYDKIPYRCIPGDQYKKVFKKDGDLQHYVENYFGEGATSCLK
jgi:DNA polymerase-1